MTPNAFRAKAIPFLMARLVDVRSPQAAAMALRPALHKLHDSLCDTLDAMVTLGRSSTLLLIGGAGCGKTLVRASIGARACMGVNGTCCSHPLRGLMAAFCSAGMLLSGHCRGGTSLAMAAPC